MLPRLLLADTIEEPDKTFIVHTQRPRFIVECETEDFDSNQVIHWQDKKPDKQEKIDELVDMARGFYELHMDVIDGMFDDINKE